MKWVSILKMLRFKENVQHEGLQLKTTTDVKKMTTFYFEYVFSHYFSIALLGFPFWPVKHFGQLVVVFKHALWINLALTINVWLLSFLLALAYSKPNNNLWHWSISHVFEWDADSQEEESNVPALQNGLTFSSTFNKTNIWPCKLLDWFLSADSLFQQ